jgi:predicted nucleic acid-binding Zn ribbon protein
MPIYEFKCNAGHITERYTHMGCEFIRCPECAEKHPDANFSLTARRIMSTNSFRLKGSGWSADNYTKPTS